MPPITVYSKGYCPFCHMAKGLLSFKGVPYEVIELDNEPERLAEMLERSGGARTVPQIFIGDLHVGGCDDLKALDRNGKLDDLLADREMAV